MYPITEVTLHLNTGEDVKVIKAIWVEFTAMFCVVHTLNEDGETATVTAYPVHDIVKAEAKIPPSLMHFKYGGIDSEHKAWLKEQAIKEKEGYDATAPVSSD
jgi:hypothetical protein